MPRAVRIVAYIALTSSMFNAAPCSGAASYPSQPTRFIVPFEPGGTNDIVARVIGVKLAESSGQSVVIDNRAGAGGVIGTQLAARAPANGYTLLMVNVNFATNPALIKNLPYDTLKDFEPISMLATSPLVLVVTPSFPARNTRELIDLAKARPGTMSYSSAGPGTIGHLAMELLKQVTKVEMEAVHYKGGGPALIDLLAGRVSPGFATIMSVIPYVRANRLRALGVSTAKRSAALPEVPTVSEDGVPGYDFTGWWGMVAPVGTPKNVLEFLNGEIGRILRQPDLNAAFSRQGAEPAHMTRTQFKAYLEAEISKWARVIKEGGITAN